MSPMLKQFWEFKVKQFPVVSWDIKYTKFVTNVHNFFHLESKLKIWLNILEVTKTQKKTFVFGYTQSCRCKKTVQIYHTIGLKKYHV